MQLNVNGFFGLVLLIADIYAMVSVLNSSSTTGKKVVWILLILFLPVLGFILWFFAGPRGKS
jgi:hypothetical protein